MKTTYSIARAQSGLPALVKQAEARGTVTITRHDETVAYLVSRDRMEAIAETLELLAHPAALKAIRDYERGRTRFRPLTVLDDEG